MEQRGTFGLGGIVLVALVALIFGALAGGITARATANSTTVQQVVSSPGSTTPTDNGPGPSAVPLSWTEVARRAGPGVVTIINHQAPGQDLFGNPVPGATAEGSGFIINAQGDIVTNDHVVAGEQSLQVVFADGRKASAQLLGHDKLSDLAVVKVSGSVPAILSWGSSNSLQPGEPVLAIGSALGQFRNTVTSGIVSALGRSITEPSGIVIQNMVQTDTAINQGNSGGPLLNDRGQVVGVNTAITRGAQQTDIFGSTSAVVAEGLGFAIGASSAHLVADRLALNKPPALLGVEYAPVDQQAATYYNFPVGAYVNTVKPNSPAAAAGIHVRDIITKIAGEPINQTFSLEQVIAEHQPGQTVAITVWRSGKYLTLKAKLTAKS